MSDFSGVIAAVHAAKPQIIFNTINGVGNLYFFRAMAEAGVPPSKLPVMSLGIAEREFPRRLAPICSRAAMQHGILSRASTAPPTEN